jgi:hypothetical protein
MGCDHFLNQRGIYGSLWEQGDRMPYYAGIGSRSTPPNLLEWMIASARRLNSRGYTLRSGGAPGADAAFEKGAGEEKEVFLAWDATPEALEMAATVHPAWDACSEYAQKLHARNCFQVLGVTLDSPVDFILCWTPDGAESKTSRRTGGTGQAIRLANSLDIPIINMKNEGWAERVKEILGDEQTDL